MDDLREVLAQITVGVIGTSQTRTDDESVGAVLNGTRRGVDASLVGDVVISQANAGGVDLQTVKRRLHLDRLRLER
ncbi:MAG: hypothetical protein JWM52_95 [Candidatus Saccharibacteria bacterium]|nr:hypothetical protein [Candidatus Saccharibacteria bacterium]